jgi:uncharacterized membrane protein
MDVSTPHLPDGRRANGPRLDSIDLVMVLMLLDHTRDFVHATGQFENPMNLATTTPWLYATRWVTHLCAPAFVWLAGTSVGLQWLRSSGDPVARRALAGYLRRRGAWLIVAELLLVRPLMYFNVDPSYAAGLQVIWAIGVGLLLLSVVLWLPIRVVGAVGLVVIAGHNLLDGLTVAPWFPPSAEAVSWGARLWMTVHQGGLFPLGAWPSPVVFAMYPLLPWLGVLCAGFGFAELYTLPAARRRSLLLWATVAMVVVFLALRLTHGYGDPIPWRGQDTVARTIMSFMNVQKYGPSLQFVLIMLAPSFLLLALADGWRARGLGAALVTFGRVPMFYYLLQWVWAHLAGMTVTAIHGGDLGFFFLNPVQQIVAMSAGRTFTVGGSLTEVYIAWGLGVVLLYWPCRWYAALKARRPDLALLRYL